VPNVRWSDLASAEVDALPEGLRQRINHLLLNLRSFPEMYPEVETGRYRGCRRFSVAGRVTVFYRVFAETGDCFVVAVRPARAKPE
jgi:plasmid stabilization system protein ParE